MQSATRDEVGECRKEMGGVEVLGAAAHEHIDQNLDGDGDRNKARNEPGGPAAQKLKCCVHTGNVRAVRQEGLHRTVFLLNNHANDRRTMEQASRGSVHPAIAALAAQAIVGLGAEPETTVGGQPVSVAGQQHALHQLHGLGGPQALLTAGYGIRRFADNPLVLVLFNSETVPELIEKIDRLNRYFHSHHRHRVHHITMHSIDLEHISRDETRPLDNESLFVCGLYLALMEQVGCSGLRVRFPQAPDGDAWIGFGADIGPIPTTCLQRWLIRWDSIEPRRSLPGLDEMLLKDLPPDLEQPSAMDDARRLILGDINRKWKLADVAEALNMSARTLQRRLGDEGWTFSRLVTQTRVVAAKRLLGKTDMGVTDIGYVVGFSDTPHFSRTFKEVTGYAPSEWRTRPASEDREAERAT